MVFTDRGSNQALSRTKSPIRGLERERDGEIIKTWTEHDQIEDHGIERSNWLLLTMFEVASYFEVM